MTPDTWTVIAVAIALAGPIVGGQIATGRRLERMEARLNGRIDEQARRIDGLSDRIEAHRKETTDQNRALGERIANVEGALAVVIRLLERRDAA